MYTLHTEAERREMLAALGLERIEELFQDIPEAHRFPELRLPPGMSELEVRQHLEALAARNHPVHDRPIFLGAGAYHRFIPAVVPALISRGEFLTAYTPYQPEISQGTLQSIYEFQSLICRLTGMEVANASVYDGATALAEGVVMAWRASRGKRTRIVLSPAVHPEYREVVHTYLQGLDLEIVGEDRPLEAGDEALLDLLDANTAALVVQYPDFVGRIQDLTPLAEAAHRAGALLIVSADPIALGLLRPPGEMGADVVTGEGQSLGIPLSFGGPHLGIMATRMRYVRQLPGRIVGKTVDAEGRTGYVLALQAREQHIRREKAVSNICTNQGVNALAATIYLSALGPRGLRAVAEASYHKAHYAADRLARIPGYALAFPEAPFFQEFVLRCPRPAEEINAYLREQGIVGGFPLGRAYPGRDHDLLLCCTEMTRREEIDRLVDLLSRWP